MLSGDAPAKIPTFTSADDRMKMSPPFSTTTSGESFRRSSPTTSATAPATEAMGPTPATRPARNILRTTGGAKSSSGRGTSERTKSGCSAIYRSKLVAVAENGLGRRPREGHAAARR